MSAGAFVVSRYQAVYSAAQIHPIKVQPETLLLAIGTASNDPPVAAPTSPISATVSGSKRSLGLNPTMVSIRFVGAPPATYKADSTIRLPLLNTAIRTAAVRSATGTYLGTPIVVVSNFSPERVN